MRTPRRPVHRVLPAVLLLAAITTALLSPAAAAPAPAGRAVWPLPDAPAVVRPFDPPPLRWLPGHRGVDLAAEPGAPVRTPIAGTVVVAGVVVDRGVVVVEAGRMRVSLEPVVPQVVVGRRVRVGDQVGVVSPDGGHCAGRGCLHWGLRVDGAYRDPLLLVLRLRPVLLPVTPPIGRA